MKLWNPSSIKVRPDEFGEVIAEHDIAVFHFWASWNAYDQTMDQVLSEIAKEYKGRIFIGSVAADEPENWSRCKELRILNLPAVASFINGQHHETIIGLNSMEFWSHKVQEWVDKY
jgi:thioredoxin-like negative regulator of GroEL